MATRIINLISCPRNLSTALMYSFAQRSDTRVVDEPFYACYLAESGAEHPGREEILRSQPQNAEAVVRSLLSSDSHPNLFLKNMAHHLEGLPSSFWERCIHLFLIRHPRKLIASFAQVMPDPGLRDIGLGLQYEQYKRLEAAGQRPRVVDSAMLLEAPAAVLEATCDYLELPFEEEMLKWEPGPRPEDGVWAKYWYKNVHRSSGFLKQPTSNRSFPEHLRSLLKEALPYYEFLLEKSVY